jgi:hypothetical protein
VKPAAAQNAYQAIGEHRLAIADYTFALLLVESLGLDATTGTLALNNRGNAYQAQGNYRAQLPTIQPPC